MQKGGRAEKVFDYLFGVGLCHLSDVLFCLIDSPSARRFGGIHLDSVWFGRSHYMSLMMY